MSDATLHTVNGEPTLRFERRLRHSPEKVWRAVTEPAELAHWFPAAVEAELRPGAPMRFTFEQDAVVDSAWDGEVLEVDPVKVFMFRWHQDVLRFELVPDGDGCLLVFTQTVGGGEAGLLGAGRTAAGWDTCLAELAGRLDGEPVPAEEDWLGAVEDYVEKFRLGNGMARPADGGGHELHFGRDLVWQPVEDVWRVLVDDAPPSTGDDPPTRARNEAVPAGTVTAVDAPRVLEYGWLHEGEAAGTVRWEIISDPVLGVRVELTQTIPEHLADLRPSSMAAWHVHLELFFAATQGDARRPWPTERVAQLTEHYTRQLG